MGTPSHAAAIVPAGSVAIASTLSLTFVHGLYTKSGIVSGDYHWRTHCTRRRSD